MRRKTSADGSSRRPPGYLLAARSTCAASCVLDNGAALHCERAKEGNGRCAALRCTAAPLLLHKPPHAAGKSTAAAHRAPVCPAAALA